MKFLIVGDVCGRPGREAFRKYVPELKKEHNIDVVVVNGENIAGGRGISRKTLDEIYRAGADIVTSGNHIWDQKEIVSFIDDEPFLIRPANYPEGAPGKGYCIYPFKAKNIGVINVSGRTFMPPMDCPFQKVDEILKEIKNQCDIICNQLIQQNYMEDPGSDVINGQLSMLTNIYGGRILIIDQDFRVIKDTYDMDRGKTIISQEVIQSFQGKETSQYDRKTAIWK